MKKTALLLFAAGAISILTNAYPKAERYAKGPTERSDLFGVRIDENAQKVTCRTLPFWACGPNRRGETRRSIDASKEVIPVGAKAEAIYLLGMVNHGWDHPTAHWGERPELKEKRSDQIYIGSPIGDLELQYADGSSDHIPLIMGATAWFVASWGYGPYNSVMKPVKEPFASRPEYASVLAKALRLHEDEGLPRDGGEFKHFYLAVRPRGMAINAVIVHDNQELRGRPLVSGITLAAADPAEGLEHFGEWRGEPSDLEPRLDVRESTDWGDGLKALAAALYTQEEDLPRDVALLDFPKDFDAARIRFLGGRWGDMLTNMWTANLMQMDQKFDPETGFFGETARDSPWYGGNMGIGTWTNAGVYSPWAYGRSSDHYATLAMRCIYNPRRWTSYVDYCDRWLYFYRGDHDPEKGPPNETLDVSSYPADAPPHWGFVMNKPGTWPKWPINELPGDEEMDGHGSTAVGRWVAWRMMGCPGGDWLTSPRASVYGKSRWDSTRDGAEFICWLMDYTGRDVIWSEGESTGWGGGPQLLRVPKEMPLDTDPVARKKKYAEANMYEAYPTYVCFVALRCSAQMADAVGDSEHAAKWRSYADRIQRAMPRELTIGEEPDVTWRSTPCVFPSGQESLVQAWFSMYLDGLDPQRWDPGLTAITRNTLKRQLSLKTGYAPVLAMGYGHGWLTQASLLMDEMDAGGRLLVNLARYCYDKNMDYVDEKRGIDWRKWLWIVPEGTHILPDGSWYRQGDLSNGANQGPAIHSLEACAGIDDTDPGSVKIMPRVPEPLTGIEVRNFLTLVKHGDVVRLARIAYSYARPCRFALSSEGSLPRLAVRLGPFGTEDSALLGMRNGAFPAGSSQRVERSGRVSGNDAYWLWVENIRDLSRVSISLETE